MNWGFLVHLYLLTIFKADELGIFSPPFSEKGVNLAAAEKIRGVRHQKKSIQQFLYMGME